MSELNTKVAESRSAQGNNDVLRQLFSSLPGSTGGELSREMDDVQNIRAGPGGGLDPEMMTPQQLHDTLWKVLSFRDNVSKKIENTLEKIPGLVSSTTVSCDQVTLLKIHAIVSSGFACGEDH